MATDYLNLGYTPGLRRKGNILDSQSPLQTINQNSQKNPALNQPNLPFDVTGEIVTRNVQISELVKKTGVGSAVGTGFVDGSSLRINTVITPFTKTGIIFLTGQPDMIVYVGTVVDPNWQVFPRFGASVANQKYSLHAGWDYGSTNGTNSVYTVNLENNSGSTIGVLAIAQWRYMSNLSGGTVSEN